jgi:dihydrodipicolinate reductase
VYSRHHHQKRADATRGGAQAMAQFIAKIKEFNADLEVSQSAPRVALTKCSFRVGQQVDLARFST